MTAIRAGLGFVLLALTAGTSSADLPHQLVRDLRQDVGRVTLETFERAYPHMVEMAGAAYFQYDDGIHGPELWRSDGTAPGTRLVRDVCPGACGGPSMLSVPSLASTGTRIVFIADDGVHGAEPWVTDGTAPGTVLLADLFPGLRESRPTVAGTVGAAVFFAADDGVHGRELWVTDGTSAGTRMVVDYVPGAGSFGVGTAAALGDALIFGGGSPSERGLWRSDGTAGGTFRISTTLPWSQGGSLANAPFVVLGDRIVFSGDDADGTNDPTLWVTDGTAAGTFELAAVPSPWAFAAGSAHVFALDAATPRRIWRTDGTMAGTESWSVPAGVEPYGTTGVGAVVADRYLLVAYDDEHGAEPWIVEGDIAHLLRDVRPGPDSSIEFEAATFLMGGGPWLTGFGSGAVFLANDGEHGAELWTTDGTEAGTAMLADLVPGPDPLRLDVRQAFLPPLALAGALLFRTWDPVAGKQLWRSDGTAAGTYPLATLDRQSSAFQPRRSQFGIWANPRVDLCFAPLAAGLLFAAENGEFGAEPWFTDGTASGTVLIADLAPGAYPSSPRACRAVQGLGLFNGWDTTGTNVFSTGGAPGDPVPLLGAPFDGGIGDLHALFLEDSFFAAAGSLWRSDGTPAGTAALDPALDCGWSDAVVWRGALYLAGNDLARSDGAPGGLVTLADETSHGLLFASRLVALGDRLLFVGEAAGTGGELWRSDGTPEGTALLVELRPGPASAFFEAPGAPDSRTRLIPLGSRVVFAADDGVAGEELWATDGTVAGTTLVADLMPGSYPSWPRELTRVGDWVYFVAEGPGVGRELWRTDGSSGGTELVADLVSGPDSALPQELTAAGSELYFSAWTPAAGREPWRLRDRAPAPARLRPLANVAPGGRSSSPLAFVERGGEVLFAANDGERGFELWRVREPDAVFADGFEGSTANVWSAAHP